MATESDEDAKARWQRHTSAWIKADGKCQKIIVTSVDDGPLQYLLNCETALEMWEKLLSIYEQKSEASIHLLQQQFFSYSKESTDDMSTHISKLVNLGRKLSVAGEPVTDNMVMTKILMTLPKEYNHFFKNSHFLLIFPLLYQKYWVFNFDFFKVQKKKNLIL